MSAIDYIKRLINEPLEAYPSYYKTYFPVIRHLVLNNDGNEQDAEELCHNTAQFLIHHTKALGFVIDHPTPTVIYSVARELWLKHLSKSTYSRFNDAENFVSDGWIKKGKLPELKNESFVSTIYGLDNSDRKFLIDYYYFRKDADNLDLANSSYGEQQLSAISKLYTLDSIVDAEKLDLFDKYLFGKLSTMESRHFEQRLKSEPELSEAYRNYYGMYQAINDAAPHVYRRLFLDASEKISVGDLEAYDPQLKGKNKSRKEKTWNYMTWIMIIGSVILMIAFIIAVMNLPDLEEKLKKFQGKDKLKEGPVVTEEIDDELKDVLSHSCTPLVIQPPIAYSKASEYITNLDSVEFDDGALINVCQVAPNGGEYIQLFNGAKMDSIVIADTSALNISVYAINTTDVIYVVEIDTASYGLRYNNKK